MRVLVQRVARASVAVDGKVVGSIGQGLLLLVGVTHEDTDLVAVQLANKIANLRVFRDDCGQMNRSALDLLASAPESCAMLVVSQFTLFADTRKGRRPSFIDAARPETAEPLVLAFAAQLESIGVPIQHGRFGAEMLIDLVNDGPVTILLDSDERRV